MTPGQFIRKWEASELKERSAAQEHFIDLCRLLDEPTPAEADPLGERYCFERGARKDTGGEGWADVWKRGCFAWEYKGKHADLGKAFNQLRQYALALENPPLLIVSDMERFRITTNWTNSVSVEHEIALAEIEDTAKRNILKWAMSDPQRLQPGETRQMVTERAAATFSRLALSLRERGCAAPAVAHFINRIVFCMFAEDVGLLPSDMFTRMLDEARRAPQSFTALAQSLFAAMSTGGRIGFEPVAWFNGSLFDDDSAFALTEDEIETTLAAAELDWSEIDPSVFGTLFERGLDPDKRAQLGAHYTARDKIMRLIEPIITRPLLAEWDRAKGEIAATIERASKAKTGAARARLQKQASASLQNFLERLREFTVLDPACGSGNFLYLALQSLKDLEHRVQLEAESLGMQRGFPAVGPANVRGIEINPYAAELARVSVWIGEIQWMRRNGFSEARDPILKQLETIECRDAVLDADEAAAEWPAADVVIGNPPFMGNKKMRGKLGDSYTDALARAYAGQVTGRPDLVCYWFAKAGRLITQGKVRRAGFVATNSIRGGTNRLVLKRILDEDCIIYDAWPDEPWVVDGAAVRVSLVCFAPREAGLPVRHEGAETSQINTDLTAGALDMTSAVRLRQNKGVAFQGVIKRGAFDIPGTLAREWLRLPANPNGRTNAEVLKPRVNAKDITSRRSDTWIVDFGTTMTEGEAALFEAPFEHVEQHVKAERQTKREPAMRRYWFRHGAPRQAMWGRLDGLMRYIATPRVSKYRLFVLMDTRVSPDSGVVAIARDDYVTFGILHSRFHEAWSLLLGTAIGKGNDPRYTPTTTFETFPFPEGLTPDIPARDYVCDERAARIGEAAAELARLRSRWLNPPDWIQWVDEPVDGYPQRPQPRDEEVKLKLKSRTLTQLYNKRPRWLADAHAKLDAAVAAAYGWEAGISEREALEALLALNRPDEQRQALIV